VLTHPVLVASQEAVAPPKDPLHVHLYGTPSPLTLLGFPDEQRLVEGTEGCSILDEVPHLPFISLI